jgi:hypothetical protein
MEVVLAFEDEATLSLEWAADAHFGACVGLMRERRPASAGGAGDVDRGVEFGFAEVGPGLLGEVDG